MDSIMAYVSAHPDAADSAQGIQSIWLGGAATREETEAALEQLVARGLLVSCALPDGGVLYAGPARR